MPALVAGWRARAPGAVRAGRALVCAVPAVRCARPGAGHLWRGAAVPLVRLVRSRLSRSRPLPLVFLPRARRGAAVPLLARPPPPEVAPAPDLAAFPPRPPPPAAGMLSEQNVSFRQINVRKLGMIWNIIAIVDRWPPPRRHPQGARGRPAARQEPHEKPLLLRL